MHIILTPQRLNETLTASLAGDVLTLNGTEFDFAELPEGATLPAEAIESPWFERPGKVERINGVLHLTLILPIGPNPSQALAFPAPLQVIEDGPIALPFDPPPEPEVVEGPVPEEVAEELPA
jgi:hypothetical protein